jgi:hypothetical protein
MTALRLVAIALLLAAVPAHAQSPGEIAFWESVRDSRNPAELQAYIDQFPNGAFVVLAKSRLAALQRSAPAAPAASTAPRLAAGEKRVPRVGDSWAYRLSYPRLRGEWGQATRPSQNLLVQASEVTPQRIVDTVSVDGGTPVSWSHAGRQLVAQGAAIFSPYLPVLDALPTTSRLGSTVAVANACPSQYTCEAKARLVGTETVTVPAGQFVASKVIVDQEWRPSGMGGGWQQMRMNGGRTLTVWYAPEIGRAVKYSSRIVAGDLPPVDANFDLELVSFDLK